MYTRPDGTVVNGTRQPFGSQNFGDNILFATAAKSAYNALQLSLRHTTGRLSIFAGYTYSESLDNSSNLQDKQPNPLNPRLSRGLSSFDITHNFVVSYSYLLPFDRLAGNSRPRLTSGWRVEGITHFATGFPIIMYEGDDHSLLGNSGGTDTPSFLGGNLNFTNPRKANVGVIGANGSPVPYFNTALFQPSAIGFEGSANKAFFHGPGLNNWGYFAHEGSQDDGAGKPSIPRRILQHLQPRAIHQPERQHNKRGIGLWDHQFSAPGTDRAGGH
jgi:hypothetical protein